MSSPEVEILLQIIDQAYDRKSWHGTNLRGSLRNVSVKQACWRPAPRRHNIWELVVHAAYWKYIVRRRLTGDGRGSFGVKGSNWWVRPQEANEKALKADLKLLDQEHRLLRSAIGAADVRQLYALPTGSKTSNFALISGIAAHDLYHAGQIQMLKRISQL
jgi:DinB family protein